MVFIYEILKIIFFVRFFKKSQFFFQKNSKFLNSQLFKGDNNFFKLRNIPLMIYQPVLIIINEPHIIYQLVLIIIYRSHIIDNLNLFINNIKKNIFKDKIIL